MGRYIRGEVDEDLLLTTLAGTTVASGIFDETVNERTLVTSIVATYTLSNMTPVAAVGPFLVGVAHSDYTTAEIEEWIEAAASWNEGDLIAQEVGRRKIRKVGVIPSPDDVEDFTAIADGRMVKTRLNWILLQGQSLQQWAYNMGSAAVATTVPRFQIEGHVNLFPK